MPSNNSKTHTNQVFQQHHQIITPSGVSSMAGKSIISSR
jgi:hypothetical protein